MARVRLRVRVGGLEEAATIEAMECVRAALREPSRTLPASADWDTDRNCLVLTVHSEADGLTAANADPTGAVGEVRSVIRKCLPNLAGPIDVFVESIEDVATG